MMRKKVQIIDDPTFEGLVGVVSSYDGYDYSVIFDVEEASCRLGFDVTGLNFPFSEQKLEIVE